MLNPKDIRICEVKISYEDYDYRTPIKFGGNIVKAVTLLNVEMRVRNRVGKEAIGQGSMPMGNIWSWPSRIYNYEETLNVMKKLASKLQKIMKNYREYGHPIELGISLEKEFLKVAKETEKEMNLKEEIPKLCILVTASAFDAAIHDAYGRLLNLNVYNAYGPEFMNYDLSHYLTDEFKGEYLDKYTLREPKEKMPLYHLIGALDPLTDVDISQRLNDGYPETLSEWIEADGLTHFKIKLNGNNLNWDVKRALSIDKVCQETQSKRKVDTWYYSTDFNEKCPNVEYLIDFLNKIKETSKECFERIQYIEQPTSRYLKEYPENKMHQAAKIKPVVIDEALVDFEHLQLAMELGYSGVALKTCKGQSQALLMGAAALKYNLFLCVQDLTLVGASFLHSAGLCARIPRVAAIEGNGRQYCPVANKGWEDKWSSIFKVKNGMLETACLTKTGLGHYSSTRTA